MKRDANLLKAMDAYNSIVSHHRVPEVADPQSQAPEGPKCFNCGSTNVVREIVLHATPTEPAGSAWACGKCSTALRRKAREIAQAALDPTPAPPPPQ